MLPIRRIVMFEICCHVIYLLQSTIVNLSFLSLQRSNVIVNSLKNYRLLAPFFSKSLQI